MNLLLRLFYRETGGVHYVKVGRLNIAFSLAPASRRTRLPYAYARVKAPSVRLRLPESSR